MIRLPVIVVSVGLTFLSLVGCHSIHSAAVRDLLQKEGTKIDLSLSRGALAELCTRHQAVIVEGIGGGLLPAGIARVESAYRQHKPSTPSAEVDAAVRAFRDTLAELAPQPWTISIDGAQMTDEFLLVEVLNIRSVGPNLVFAPDASPSDGYFDVITAQETDRTQIETYFEQRLAGRDTRLALPRQRARHVSITSCTEMHIDDERIDTCALGPISIEIAHAAISVLL